MFLLDGLHEELAKWVQPCAVLLSNPEQLSVAGYAYVLCTYPCRYSESADVTVEESEGDEGDGAHDPQSDPCRWRLLTVLCRLPSIHEMQGKAGEEITTGQIPPRVNGQRSEKGTRHQSRDTQNTRRRRLAKSSEVSCARQCDSRAQNHQVQ